MAPARTSRFSATEPPLRRRLLDPGWLFLLGGLALVGAGVLVPAHDRLQEARWQRDRARALLEHHERRLERYQRYLATLEEADEPIVRSLTAVQLNKVDADRELLATRGRLPDASVFAAIEPEPMRLPSRNAPRSRLRRLMMDPSTRLWLVAGGVLAIVIGLLPRTRARATPPS